MRLPGVPKKLQHPRVVRRSLDDFGKLLMLRGLLVDLIGIEPMTSSMPWKRAPSCATGPHRWGQLFHSRCSSLIRQTDVCPKQDEPQGQVMLWIEDQRARSGEVAFRIDSFAGMG